jgi:hypothetical protein
MGIGSQIYSTIEAKAHEFELIAYTPKKYYRFTIFYMGFRIGNSRWNVGERLC